jgi:prevent-host-death family protein
MAISDGYNGPMKISVAEAKDKLTKLLKEVEKGKKVTICRRGIPVAELTRVPKVAMERRELGFLRGQGIVIDPDWWKPMDDEEAETFLEGRY